VTDYQKLRLGAVQAAPVWLDLEKTVEKACGLIREAGENGAQFIGFPENYLPGYPAWYNFLPATSKRSRDLAVRLFKNSVEIKSKEVDALCEAAAESRVFVVMGITERRPDTTGTLYNTQLFIDQYGKIVGKHQKIMPTVGERLVHAAGSGKTLGSVSSSWGPVSGLICGENSNPMAVGLLATQYPRIHVANWPYGYIPNTIYPAHQLASRNVAYMCKCYVISAVGIYTPEIIDDIAATDEDRKILSDPSQAGGSVIIDPHANIIAGPLEGDKEGIIYADANLDLAVEAHLVHDYGGHYNRPDIFQLSVAGADMTLIEDASKKQRPPSQEAAGALETEVTAEFSSSPMISFKGGFSGRHPNDAGNNS